MLDSRPLWRNYRMRTKWESSQAWLSESIVTQPSVKPHAGGGCWRHKRRLKTSLRFVIALFANLGDLDEILQLDNSDWHSTFCKSQFLASADIWHFVVVTWHSNLHLRPQNAVPGDRCLHFPPGYATVFKTESQVCFKSCIQSTILTSNQATKIVILTYTSKPKP